MGFSRQIRMLDGVITILSSPKRAMSPFIVLINSHSSFMAFLVSSMSLVARGVTFIISMLPVLTSCCIVPRSVRLRSGVAFR